MPLLRGGHRIMTLETTKPKNVIAAVAAHYHTTPDNLCNPRDRSLPLPEARAVCAFLLTKYGGLSMRQAGDILGRSSVSHIVGQIERMYRRPETHADVLANVTLLREKLYKTPPSPRPRPKPKPTKAQIKANIARLIPLKVCAKCGREYPLGDFRRADLSISEVCCRCHTKALIV